MQDNIPSSPSNSQIVQAMGLDDVLRDSVKKLLKTLQALVVVFILVQMICACAQSYCAYQQLKLSRIDEARQIAADQRDKANVCQCPKR